MQNASLVFVESNVYQKLANLYTKEKRMPPVETVKCLPMKTVVGFKMK